VRRSKGEDAGVLPESLRAGRPPGSEAAPGCAVGAASLIDPRLERNASPAFAPRANLGRCDLAFVGHSVD